MHTDTAALFNWSVLFPNFVLIAAFISIMLEKIPKVATALLGASLLLVCQYITQAEAFAAIDFNVITLLVGMMILINILGHTGALNALGWPWFRSDTGGHPAHLSDRDIMREIIGGSGHGNMEPLLLHFGLNTHMSAQNMTIYWPSRDPETNQRKVTYIDGPIDANLSYTYVEDIGFVGLKGDINEDDVVNVQDVVISVNLALDITPPESTIFWTAQ